MAELKTRPTGESVTAFIDGAVSGAKRDDAYRLLALMQRLSGQMPTMWGPSIVGFGSYHFVYASGREGDWMEIGFSPRKSALSLYLMGGVHRHGELLAQLGKHRVGKSCLYINKLADVNLDILERLVAVSLHDLRNGDVDYGAC